MTLIVSFRTPDGIVIAGDSLSTITSQEVTQQTITAVCPHCKREHQFNNVIHAPPIPQTTFSYAQKIFPFYEKYGIGIFGIASLSGRSIRFVIRSIENNLMNEGVTFQSVEEVANRIGTEVHNLLAQQLALEKRSIDSLPENNHPLGMQVVGYDGNMAKTIEIFIGKDIVNKPIDQPGYTFSGNYDVINAIHKLYEQPSYFPAFHAFSLQDAIDYVDFLINTTIQHQRFAPIMPNVGGSIDIGLITPFDVFKWIRQKALYEILEGR